MQELSKALKPSPPPHAPLAAPLLKLLPFPQLPPLPTWDSAKPEDLGVVSYSSGPFFSCRGSASSRPSLVVPAAPLGGSGSVSAGSEGQLPNSHFTHTMNVGCYSN